MAAADQGLLERVTVSPETDLALIRQPQGVQAPVPAAHFVHLENKCGVLYLAQVVILSFSALNLPQVMNDKDILKITEAPAS